MLDGEIVVRDGEGREDFDALGQRIHPAVSRIERLAVETPAVYVAFDLLAHEDELAAGAAVRRAPRRARAAARRRRVRGRPVELMQTVETAAEAERWLQGAEGAIAKERSAPYRPGERKGMVKVKRVRTIDAVIVGWRPGKEEGTVGALILGLYDGDELRVVGHCSGLTASEKKRLVGFLADYESGERGSGGPQPLELGQGSRVDRTAPRAGDRDRLRPRLRRAHPPRRQARRWREDKAPARVHLRSALTRQLSVH